MKDVQSNNLNPKIGDVFLMKFDGNGSAQKGWRPGIVIQNNVGNKYSPNIVAIPLTTATKNMFQPTHVAIPSKKTGLQKDSMALCECPESVPKYLFGEYLTTLSGYYMNKIAKAFLKAYPVLYYMCERDIAEVREVSHNFIFA